LSRLIFILLALVTLVFMVECPTVWAQDSSQQGGANEVEEGNGTNSEKNHSLVFLAIQQLPPFSYAQDGKQVGIIVDIAEAVKEQFRRPVSLKYMDWSEAQQLMLKGDADALFHINPSEERKKIFDFSDGLLESDFSIFVKDSGEHIYTDNDLRGLRVGVLNKGLAFNLLSQDPLINLVTFPNILPGYYALKKGDLDAVVMERQVGIFLLAENNIRGIRITGEPIDRSFSAIAVKKGNTELLAEINRALAEIRGNGTYSEIMADWGPKEVVFQTREQFQSQKSIIIILSVLSGIGVLSILLILLWNKSLASKVAKHTAEIDVKNTALLLEIAERETIEQNLRESRDYLENITDCMGDVVFSIKMPERIIEWIKDRSEILGYTPEECIGKRSDFFYENHNDYLAIGEKLAMAITKGKDVIYTEANLRRKSGEIFPVEATLAFYRVNNEVVSLIGILRDVSVRKSAEKTIFEYQKRLKALASQLTIAEEKQKQAIAIDLHDNVAQSLALLRIQVAHARKQTSDPGMTSKLGDIYETLLVTLQETRSLMTDLSPPSMGELGFSAAILEWLEGSIANRHSLKTEFIDSTSDREKDLLEENVQVILFRNVRELLANIVKHAEAENVHVSLQIEDNMLKISVKDDGIGFDPEVVIENNGWDRRFGLFAVEERVSDVDGTFEIISEPKKGCTIIMKVPVQRV
jgi:PAS domain S-box-containing protein